MRAFPFPALLTIMLAACAEGDRVPVRFERVAGEGQAGVAGRDLPQPLVVRVTDARGAGIAGVPVEWALGEDARIRVAARTDAYGLARAVWVLDPYGRTQYASARVQGLPPVTFTATASGTRTRPRARGPRPPAVVAADIVALAPDWTPRRWSGADTLAIVAPRVLHARLVSIDGSATDGVLVHLRTRERRAPLRVTGDGFAFALSQAEAAQPIEVLVTDDAARARFHPMRLRTSAGAPLTLLLVPRELRLRGGTYGGTAVPVAVERAFRPACAGCPAFYRAASSGASAGSSRLAAWPADALPLRVSFDAGDSLARISAADSVAFWRIAAAFSRAFGVDLLTPAGLSGDDGSLRVAVDPRQLHAGESTTATQAHEIFSAEITVQRPGMIAGAGGTYLTTHELLHALGFGHTCSWRSVLADLRKCPDMHAEWLTPEDVAYVQLVRRIHELETRLGAHGTLEALRAGAQ